MAKVEKNLQCSNIYSLYTVQSPLTPAPAAPSSATLGSVHCTLCTAHCPGDTAMAAANP